jgi:hypothetical protein
VVVSVEEARARLADGINRLLSHAKAVAQGLEKPSPFLFETTTGLGKSSAIRQWPSREDAPPLLVLVPDHHLAATYESAGFAHYIGRNADPMSHSFCPKYGIAQSVASMNHAIQSAMCARCPHEMKRKLLSTTSASERAMLIQGIRKTKSDVQAIMPCPFTAMREAIMKEPFVVAPSSSISRQLATYVDPHGVMKRRVILVDERASLSRPIVVSEKDIALWQAVIDHHFTEAKEKIDQLLRDCARDLEDTMPMLEARQAALARSVISVLSRFLSGLCEDESRHLTHAERVTLELPLRLLLDEGSLFFERIIFDDRLQIKFAPKRAVMAILNCVANGSARVEKKSLACAEPTLLLELTRTHVVAFFDATPSLALKRVVKTLNGHVIEAKARQNIHITRHLGHFFGITPWVTREKAELSRYMSWLKRFPNRVFIAHKRAVKAILAHAPEEAQRMGHWGLSHRGIDDFSSRDMVILGSFFPPPATWPLLYMMDRHVALSMGDEASAWPLWTGDMEKGVEVMEGSRLARCFAPLPKDPFIRAWLLQMVTAETVQAIGRSRAVNAKETVHVIVAGGFPLAGIEDHGLSIDAYLD